MAMSSLDLSFRRFLVFSKLFTKSWGSPKVIADIYKHRRNVMANGAVTELLETERASKISMIKIREEQRDGVYTFDGKFRSPHALLFPEMMKDPVGWAFCKGFFPAGERRSLVIHLAGTGDHSYFRREWGMVRGLLEKGTASILLENPFYGNRRPAEQFRSSLLNVSDLFVMGAALIAECLWLLRWARLQGFDGPLGLSGVSMGGHMSSLAATNVPYPVCLVPCLSWTTAAPVYTVGALSSAINWDILEKEIKTKDYRDGIRRIPKCTLLEEAEAEKLRNKKSLSYNFMRVLMEEFTSLQNFPKPVDVNLIRAVVAENDAYVVREGAPRMEDLWPGCEVVVMPGEGHVSAYFRGHSLFREAVQTMLAKNESRSTIVG